MTSTERRGRHRAAPRRRVVRPEARRRAGSLLASGALAALTTLAVVGAVEAFMTVGAGAGSASASSAVEVRVDPAAGPADLRPGAAGTVRARVTNPTNADVVVGGLSLDRERGDGGVVTSDPACPARLLSFTAPDVGAADGHGGWRVPARAQGVDGERAISLPGSLHLHADAPDACQGVDVTVHLTAD